MGVGGEFTKKRNGAQTEKCTTASTPDVRKADGAELIWTGKRAEVMTFGIATG
jgi:hypothetical protein